MSLCATSAKLGTQPGLTISGHVEAWAEVNIYGIMELAFEYEITKGMFGMFFVLENDMQIPNKENNRKQTTKGRVRNSIEFPSFSDPRGPSHPGVPYHQCCLLASRCPHVPSRLGKRHWKTGALTVQQGCVPRCYGSHVCSKCQNVASKKIMDSINEDQLE